MCQFGKNADFAKSIDDSRQLALDFEQPAAATPASPSKNTLDAAGRFATQFAAILEADESASLNNPAVNQLAREIFGAPLAQATPDDIVGLLIGGAIIQLDNGWRLMTDRISGDDVTELVLNGVAAVRNELLGYGLTEEIIHYKRRWFMSPDDAEQVPPLLLARRRPVRDLSNVDADEAKFDDDDE